MMLRIALTIIGVAALLMGLVWIGQGTGYLSWPRSFMTGASEWSTRGLVLAIAGAAMILIARRVGR